MLIVVPSAPLWRTLCVDFLGVLRYRRVSVCTKTKEYTYSAGGAKEREVRMYRVHRREPRRTVARSPVKSASSPLCRGVAVWVYTFLKPRSLCARECSATSSWELGCPQKLNARITFVFVRITIRD